MAILLTRAQFPTVDIVFLVGPLPAVRGDAEQWLTDVRRALDDVVERRDRPAATVVTICASVDDARVRLHVDDRTLTFVPSW